MFLGENLVRLRMVYSMGSKGDQQTELTMF